MSPTPAIRISRTKCNTKASADDSRSSAVTPMAIPMIRPSVPPPLPPPRNIEISTLQDPGWQWGNNPNDDDFGKPASVKPGSSLWGDSLRRQRKELDIDMNHFYDDRRRNSSISTVTLSHDHTMPEERLVNGEKHGNALAVASNTELKGEQELRQRTVELSSQTYDKHLLSRIGGPNATKRQPLLFTSGGTQDPDQGTVSNAGRQNSTASALSAQEGRHGSIDSVSSMRWPASVTIGYGYGSSEASLTSASRHGSLMGDDSSSHRGSYDHSMFPSDDLFMDNGEMNSLYLEERSSSSPKAGSKRRASSPPREPGDRASISSASGQSDIFPRRSLQQMGNRISPVSRFHPSLSSLSSTSSAGPRHGSLGSTISVTSVPSSATSYTSGRISPSLTSLAADADMRNTTLRSRINGVTSSPIAIRHHRTLSETTPIITRRPSVETVPNTRHESLSHLPAFFVCDCCPKKPRKFDTEDELRIHESEKQYTCAYCSNRFKNKNEAERHQNSLHLRLHSWSCGALAGIEAAFQPISSGCNSDACGYCGQEYTNPPEWDLRADHLNHVHKFTECNIGKKFFRADHFRQHLKHSHQGTSGKWTNILENACMKDEPPPEPRINPVAVTVPSEHLPPTSAITTITSSNDGIPLSTEASEGVLHET